MGTLHIERVERHLAEGRKQAVNLLKKENSPQTEENNLDTDHTQLV